MQATQSAFMNLKDEFNSESDLFNEMQFSINPNVREDNISGEKGSQTELQSIAVNRQLLLKTSNNDSKNSRIILSEQDARAIFQNKPPNGGRDRRRADMLASLYGVSVKTIRDIWVGRTWYRSTCHLDPSKPVNLHRLQRKPGRPLGAKDSKPRTLQPTRRDAHSPPQLSSLASSHAIAAPACCASPAAALAVAWSQAPTPLADWLDRGSWAASAGWDDPFHDDWPFWAPNDAEAEAEPASVDAHGGGAQL